MNSIPIIKVKKARNFGSVIISLLVVFAFTVFFLGIFSEQKTFPVQAITCQPCCYPNNGLNVCTGPGGCVSRGGCGYCYDTEFCASGYCCDECEPCCGTCNTCTASCPTYYSTTNTNCSYQQSCCTRYDSCGECGQTCIGCWLVKYTLTYTAGTGGTISGTTSQSICRGSNGTAVTAVPNTGYAFQNWSDSSTSNPRTDSNVTANISVTANFYLTNNAPGAPTSLLTEGATNPVGVVDTAPEFSAIYVDGDSGDQAVYYEIEVNTQSDFLGTSMWDTGKTSMTALTAGNRVPDKSYAGTALSLNGTTYYWRIRFWDDSDAQGTWSSTASFAMDTAPSAGSDLLTEGLTNPIGVVDLTPEFSAIFNDPDSGDLGVYYRIEVNTNSTFSGTVMWDSGKTSMSAVTAGNRTANISYAGTVLTTNGVTYYWRIRFWDDSDIEGAVSSFATFTMDNPPTASLLETEGATNPTGVVDLAPEFSAQCNDADSGHTCDSYEIEVNTNSSFSGTVMWDSGLLSMTPTANGFRSPQISYAGTALTTNGTTYYWRIRFADNVGVTGSWSSTAQFTMNTSPTAPTLPLTEGQTNPVRVCDLTPEFSAICNDPDSGQTCNYYQVLVTAGAVTIWDSGLQSMTPTAIGARSPDISYAGTALSPNGNSYDWQIRFADNVGTVGEWSSTAQFTMSYAPTAPSILHTEGSSNALKVIDITPEFSSIFSDLDAPDTGNYYEIEVNTNNAFSGTVMWDSGQVSIGPISNGSRSTDISYAGSVLSENGSTYYWRMRYWDQCDFVSDWSSTSQYTMNGSPFAPTGLLTDGMTNPTVVNSGFPEFSAIYDDPNGDSASAYEIEVNSNNTFTGTVMWDTGKISTTITDGNRSPDYTYAGTALTQTSGITYYWRIRFWDSDDKVSEWSATATFRDLSVHMYLGGLTLKGVQVK